MHTEVLTVDPHSPAAGIVAQAAGVLQAGGVVAFPTETVYGLAANALEPAAVGRIFAAKGRPENNPLIVHVLDAVAAQELTTVWPETARILAERFWPGPLTIVLPKCPQVPDAVTAGLPSVALRVPRHPVARALIEAAAFPLAAPSANPSTRISATTAEHVRQMLSNRIDMILDGGPTTGGLESTVVDLTGSTPRLLRPGLVSREEIEAALGGPIQVGGAAVDESRPMHSPGLMARHYAPQVPLECVAGDGSMRVAALLEQGLRVGWLTLSAPPLQDLRPPTSELRANVIALSLPAEAKAYSAGLYSALHALENAGVERIVVATPPDEPAWLAVHDRLRRAGTPA